MTEPLALRIHIQEPWDFERFNGRPDIEGETADHRSGEARAEDEWVVTLDAPFELRDERYDAVLVSPLYVGERLAQLFQSIVGFPVRIAHRDADGDWHYAMTGLLSVRHDKDRIEGNGPR